MNHTSVRVVLVVLKVRPSPPGGFANAETRYAGSPGTGSLHSGNSHAVCEYDIACFQVTQNH